jgi:hypothetical protein
VQRSKTTPNYITKTATKKQAFLGLEAFTIEAVGDEAE